MSRQRVDRGRYGKKVRQLAIGAMVGLLAVTGSPAVAQSVDRGLDVQVRELMGSTPLTAGRQYAVIIGIDRYAEWPSLHNAVRDAQEIRDILRERYYIDEFIELYDSQATAAAIRRLFAEQLPAQLGVRDSVLVFYAGHGHTEHGTGAWIAHDGTRDVYDQRGWIPNAQLRAYIERLQVRHVLVLADSCFSGDLLDPQRGEIPLITSEFLRRAYSLTSRQVLTSGASETVSDNSEFARQLKNLLRQNEQPYLSAISIYDRVRLGVRDTLPLFGDLPGHERGAGFLLFMRESPMAELGTEASTRETAPAAPAVPAPPVQPGFEIDRGSVRVSVAAAATILVDGRELGSLAAGQSATLSDIEVGQRSVVARYANGQTESQTVTISVAQTPSVAFSFGFGTIRVSLTSAGAVSLDGVQMGNLSAGQSATLNDVAAGNRRVEVRYANGQSETQTVSVSANQTASASFARAWGSLRVGAVTAGTVWVDGANKGSVSAGQSATLNDVAAGNRRVEVRYANGQSETQTVSVAANQTASATFARAWGSLRVGAVTAGTVWVDGANKGSVSAGSSVSLNNIEAGSRRVEVRYANGQSEMQTVTVMANQTGSANFAYTAPVVPAIQVETWTSPSGFRMVGVPAGSFQMGSPSGGDSDERPVRQVTVSGFWMMQTEVTQGLYQSVMGGNPSASDRGIGTNNPVNRVSWYDALVFANRLSMREGLTPVYSIGGSTDPGRWGSVPTDNNSTWNAVTMNRSANGYRLPTEAEWEYAARGATASRNTTYAGSNSVNDVAWHSGNSGSRTQAVGTKAANELGLHDMSGNVWEWVWDWYGNYPTTAQTDPSGPSSGTYRVLRGGSWGIYESGTRVANRNYDYSLSRDYTFGFRLLRSESR